MDLDACVIVEYGVNSGEIPDAEERQRNLEAIAAMLPDALVIADSD